MVYIRQAQVCRLFCFFFQAEDGIRDLTVTGVQTCALPISSAEPAESSSPERVYAVAGPVIIAILGILGLRAASSGVLAIPIRKLAAMRIASNRPNNARLASNSSGNSVPLIPSASAATNTLGFAASTIEASI